MQDFTDRDLRNVSFGGRNLEGADFSGADIRGCDFSHAILTNANFESVKAGREPIKFFGSSAIALIVGLASFHAYSQMLFGIVGLTAEDPASVYTYPLQICLGIAALGSLVKTRHKIATIIAIALSSAASGALLGFFYLGTIAAKNPTLATWGAVAGAILFVCLALWQRRGRMQVAIAALGAVAAYGLTFLFVARASAYLSVGRIGWGMAWSGLSLALLAATIAGLCLTRQQIERQSTTSFRHADLTEANLAKARWGSTDFSSAIGFEG